MRLFFSNTVTLWPTRASCCAAANPAGPEPTTATFLPVFFFAGLRHHPAVLAALVDDGVLDGLDADRVVVDVQRAGRFARRRADAAGHFGEVVGGMQYFQRLFPVAAIHQVVPVGNDVVDRAAVVAERDAAIHATRALLLGFGIGEMRDELVVVLGTLLDWRVALADALKLHETSWLAHYAASFCCAAISSNARRYSVGMTFTNLGR